jgi:hypothetical protein
MSSISFRILGALGPPHRVFDEGGVRTRWHAEGSRERLARISAARATKSRAIGVPARTRGGPNRGGIQTLLQACYTRSAELIGLP